MGRRSNQFHNAVRAIESPLQTCDNCRTWRAPPAAFRAPLRQRAEFVMNSKKTSWTVLLALLCVPASAVGIVLGFLVGCVIAMILQGIFAPGAGYDHYSVGTPVGNVAILPLRPRTHALACERPVTVLFTVLSQHSPV